MSANNIQIELDAVTALAERLKGAMDANNLAQITPDPFNALFENSIATTLQGTLNPADKTGDQKGRKISKLTSDTIQIEKLGDQQGQAAASKLSINNFVKIGQTNLGVKSSSTDVDNKGTDIAVKTDDEANDFEQIMKDLDYESYIKVMETLNSMEKDELQSYLTEISLADDLKQYLLASPKIDADLRQVLFNMEDETIQVGLKNILENQNPSDDLTQEIIYNFYKQDLNSFNSMTPNDTSSIVETAEALITGTNMQDQLKKLYTGQTTDASETTRNFFASVLDTISSQTDISQMDLVSNAEYAGPLKDVISNVGQTLSHINTASKYSGNSVGSLLTNLTKGV